MFRRALELDPMNPTARFGVARAEAEKGNYQASLDIARPVIEAFRLFPEGLFVLATDFLKTGDRQRRSRSSIPGIARPTYRRRGRSGSR